MSLRRLALFRDFKRAWDANWGYVCLAYLYSSLDTLSWGNLRQLVRSWKLIEVSFFSFSFIAFILLNRMSFKQNYASCSCKLYSCFHLVIHHLASYSYLFISVSCKLSSCRLSSPKLSSCKLCAHLESTKSCSVFYLSSFALFFFFFFLIQPQHLTKFSMNSAFVHCSWTHKFHFSATFSLKMGSATLFTHLKIILLQCFQFQFSVSATISSIQMDPISILSFPALDRSIQSHCLWYRCGSEKFPFSQGSFQCAIF